MLRDKRASPGGAGGDRYSSTIIGGKAPVATYSPAPLTRLGCDGGVWSMPTKKSWGNVEPAGTVFVPVPGSTPLELTLGVTSCLPL
jgi:hypothetical protein